MANWTLTPDGLRTDDQLWAEDFFSTCGSFCPMCGNDALTAAPLGVLCKIVIHGDARVEAAIACNVCHFGWCKACLEPAEN